MEKIKVWHEIWDFTINTPEIRVTQCYRHTSFDLSCCAVAYAVVIQLSSVNQALIASKSRLF